MTIRSYKNEGSEFFSLKGATLGFTYDERMVNEKEAIKPNKLQETTLWKSKIYQNMTCETMTGLQRDDKK